MKRYKYTVPILAAGTTGSLRIHPAEGILRRVTVVCPANDGGVGATYAISLVDDNSLTIWTIADAAENAETSYPTAPSSDASLTTPIHSTKTTAYPWGLNLPVVASAGDAAATNVVVYLWIQER